MVTEEMGDGATSCEDNNTCPKNQSLTSFVGGSPGFLGDVSGGFADTVINTVRLVTDPIAAMTSPQLHMWGNQNSGGYELGQALSAVAPAVAAGPEADAALFGADVGTDAGLGVLGGTAGSTAGRATMDIQGVYRGGPIVGLDNSVDAAVTRSADGTWRSRGSWSLGAPARTDLGTASAGTGQPATYAVSVANPEASTVAGVLTENEDDLTNALTAYSGSAHALDPGIPAVSDPVASATVVAAALIAALFQSLAGTGG